MISYEYLIILPIIFELRDIILVFYYDICLWCQYYAISESVPYDITEFMISQPTSVSWYLRGEMARVGADRRQVLHRLQPRHNQHAEDVFSTEQWLKFGTGDKMKEELESATGLRPVSECRGTWNKLKSGILSSATCQTWNFKSTCVLNFKLMNVNKLTTYSRLTSCKIRQPSSLAG
jgi:hypothetical protein